MCGGFSCLAGSGNRSQHHSNSIYRISLYNLGRLLSYLCLVNLIYAFDVSLKNLSILTSFAAVLLVVIILAQLGQLLGLGHIISKNKYFKTLSERHTNYYAILFSKITNNNSKLNTLYLGILTTLIPCGWLYINIGLASAQENILKSNLTIFAFWLGTIPALSALALSSFTITKKFNGISKVIAYLIILLLSFYSVSKHFPIFSSKTSMSKNSCHTSNHKEQ